jgi:hypothetical protein
MNIKNHIPSSALTLVGTSIMAAIKDNKIFFIIENIKG